MGNGSPALCQASVGTLLTPPDRNCEQLYSHGSTPIRAESLRTPTGRRPKGATGHPI
ncbi:hypothetical protein FAIPA1_30232 [Frankia sp. AiPs1]